LSTRENTPRSRKVERGFSFGQKQAILCVKLSKNPRLVG
jgi:hypothetical protein